MKTFFHEGELWISDGRVSFPTRFTPDQARRLATALRKLPPLGITQTWSTAKGLARFEAERVADSPYPVLTFHGRYRLQPTAREYRAFATALRAYGAGRRS